MKKYKELFWFVLFLFIIFEESTRKWLGDPLYSIIQNIYVTAISLYWIRTVILKYKAQQMKKKWMILICVLLSLMIIIFVMDTFDWILSICNTH